MVRRLRLWLSALLRRVGWWLQSGVVQDYHVRLTEGGQHTARRVVSHRIVGNHLELVDIDGTLHLVNLEDVRSVRPAVSLDMVDLTPFMVAE